MRLRVSPCRSVSPAAHLLREGTVVTKSSNRAGLIAEAGLVIALAVVLNALTVVQMPQGGSVSLVMLPLFVFALRRGVGLGLAVGAAYGVIDAIIKPYVVHWAQFILDYPVAFAAVGLAGLFSTAFVSARGDARFVRGAMLVVVPGILLGTVARYAVHVVSGVIYFSEYAPEGTPVVWYSLAYNAFVLVSGALCLLAAPFVLRAIPALRLKDRS